MRIGMTVAVACACTACSNPRCVVVLFDASKTVTQEGMLEHYMYDFKEKILSSLESRDVVLANVIVEEPLITTGVKQWPIEIRVKNLFWFTEFGKQNALKRLRKEQADELGRLQEIHTRASPIIDALKVAGGALQDRACRDVEDRRIVVFSDMLENSARWEIKDDLKVRIKDLGERG